MKDYNKQIKAHSTLFAILSALFTGSAFLRLHGISTASDAALWILLLLVPFYKKAFETEEIKYMPALCAMFFTAAYVAANLSVLLSYDTVWETIFSAFCCVVGLYVFFKNAVKLLYRYLWDKSAVCGGERIITKKKKALLFFCSAGLILICRIPYFMYVFPGNVLYDSVMQLLMAEGHMHLSSHHSVPHTLFIKFFFDLGTALFGSQTAGAALYSIAQSVVMAFSFAYVAETMYTQKIKKPAIYITLAYYCFMPYHNDFSFTMLKDVMFGGITAVLCAVLWRMAADEDSDRKISPDSMAVFFIFSVLFCLFRNNAFFAYILFLPIFIAVFVKKHRTAVLLAVAAFLCAAFIKGPVYSMCDIHHSDIMESFSLPAQHIGRTIRDGGQLSSKQYELLSKIVEVEKIPETYFPSVADPMKELVGERDNVEYLENHKAEYFKLWLELGLKYPKSYILAQIDETSGFYYPDTVSWVYGTVDFSGETYGFNIHKLPLMPKAFCDLFTASNQLYRKVHFLGLLWSIGFMCWIMIFTAGLSLAKGKRKYIVAYIPVMAVIATLIIATPVNSEFRYAYSLFTAMPIFCVLPFVKKAKAPQNAGASVTQNQ